MKKLITYELDEFEIEEAILLYLAYAHQIEVLSGTRIELKVNENDKIIGLVNIGQSDIV